jgi:Flp pilus assembly pilin Flp
VDFYSDKGAIAGEYALITALVILAALGAMICFGEAVVDLWVDAGNKIIEALTF